ncbi:MAG: HAMP domain-containing protein [Anaerolineae bacterium]|nr:HAMP domain-containing protein [Anaerolineae bacterium]
MTDTASILLLSAITLVTVCLPLILAYQFWRRWEAVRRERLHWAIVHTNLLTALIIVALIALREGINGVSTAQTIFPSDAPLLTILTVVIPALFSLILAIPPVMAVMALTAFIAHRTAAPIIQHIEALAGTMDALRAGNYAARSPVGGQIELQRLQVGFNDMAAELETTLQALQRERDSMLRLLETRRELFAEVSHELRTPAATLRGYLDSALVNWDADPPTTLRHDLEIMSHETDRLKRLIDDLFLLARAEVGKLALTIVETDVGTLASLAVQTVAPLAWERGRVRVVADIADHLPKALADSARLEQILQNLLYNAVRHTPPGGIVVVHAAADPPTQTLRLEVRDTGEGIPPDELTHVWERFYQGAAQTGGAGIGLALVKELTTAMGGSVTLDSAPGQGSCFTLCLQSINRQ